MRFKGTIKFWNDDRGFGFIEPTDGGQQIFVHYTAFASHYGRPQLNQHVSFEIELGPQGKKRASKVLPANADSGQTLIGVLSAPTERGVATLLTIPVFMTGYAVVHVLWDPHLIVAAIYVGVSVFTFVTYARDKTAAKRGTWRTSESALHMLALFCGWPGALLAQQILRHKSSKVDFRTVFWGTVVLNVIGFVFLSSPVGRSFCAAQFDQLKESSRTADRGYEW